MQYNIIHICTTDTWKEESLQLIMYCKREGLIKFKNTIFVASERIRLTTCSLLPPLTLNYIYNIIIVPIIINIKGGFLYEILTN